MPGRAGVLLGIDLGTTAVKVGLFDLATGRPAALAWREYQAASPAPGWAELEVSVYWEAAVGAVRQALAEAGQPEVLGLGLSSQGQTFAPFDAAFRPLRPAIVWLDARAEVQAQALRELFEPEDYRRRTGFVFPSAVDSDAKLLWIREREPQVWARTRHVMLLADYLGWRLTGERRLDVNNAGSTGLVDQTAGTWWPEALAATGIPGEWFSPLGRPGDLLGQLGPAAARELGLPPGLPVALGSNDQLNGAVGVGNLQPGTASGTVGTALALVATTARVEGQAARGLLSGPHPQPGLRFLMTYAKTSGIVLTWLRGLCAPGESYEELLAEAAALPPEPAGPVCLPHFSGTATPTFRSDVRGAILGLTLGHQRAHLVRAVAEAVCFSARDALELLARAGAAPVELRMLGGATRSAAWMQMLADVLNLPLQIPACGEAAVLGAAIFAGLGAGVFGELREGADLFYRVERHYEPATASADRYAGPGQAYRSAMERLYPGALGLGPGAEGADDW